MTEIERLTAMEAIRRIKATYCRGVDTADPALVRSILHPDCELDYRGCFVDPATGVDFFPAMGIVIKGRENFAAPRPTGGTAEPADPPAPQRPRMITVHQVYTPEIEITSETTATAIWPMTDRLWLPAGSPYAAITGYGYYHETYEKVDAAWKLKTTRLARIRVEGTCW